MRYRRLGRTDLMVSELGLEVRATLGAGSLAEGEDDAAAALRAAIDGGVTLFTWDVSDAAEDVEPLVIRAAGVDRGRLTLLAVLDFLPPPEAIGPQVEAIASRLAEGEGGGGNGNVPGYLDVIAFPGVPDAAQIEALEAVRRRGTARFVAVAADGDAGLPADLPAGVDVLVLGGAPSSVHATAGVVARARLTDAPALLADRAISSVVTSAADAGEVAGLLVHSY